MLGKTIEKIDDIYRVISETNDDEYDNILNNVANEGNKLRKGIYMSSAIDEAVEKVLANEKRKMD